MAYLTLPKIAADLKRKGVVPPADHVSYEQLGAHFLKGLSTAGYIVHPDTRNNTIGLTLGDERMLIGRGSLRNKGTVLPLTGAKKGAPGITLEEFWQQVDPAIKFEGFAKLPVTVRPTKTVGETIAGPVPASTVAAPAAQAPAPVTVTPLTPAVATAPAAPVEASLDELLATPAAASKPTKAASPTVPPLAEPVSSLVEPPGEPSLDDILAATPATAHLAPPVSAPVAATPAKNLPPSPALHGKLLAAGPAPYMNKPENTRSFFLTVETKDGGRTLWGVDLERAIAVSNVRVGDSVSVAQSGTQPVGDGTMKRKVWQIEKLTKPVLTPAPATVAPRVAPAATPPGTAPAAPVAVAPTPAPIAVPAVAATSTAPLPAVTPAQALQVEEQAYVAENVRAVLALSCFADSKFDAFKKDALDLKNWKQTKALSGVPAITEASIGDIKLDASTLLALNVLSRPPEAQRTAALAFTKGVANPLIGQTPAETVENLKRYLLQVPPTQQTAVALMFLADKPASFKGLVAKKASTGLLAHDELLEKLVLGNINFTPRQAIGHLEFVTPDARQWQALSSRPDVAAFSGAHTEADKPHMTRLLGLGILAKALPQNATEADVHGKLLGALSTPHANDAWESLRDSLGAQLAKDREIIRAAEVGMARIASTAKSPVAYGKNPVAFTEAAQEAKQPGFFQRMWNKVRPTRSEASTVAPSYVTLSVTPEQLARIKPLLDGRVDYKESAQGLTNVNLGRMAQNTPEFLANREKTLQSVEQRLDQRQRQELNLSAGLSI